jgi:hypothetical protein
VFFVQKGDRVEVQVLGVWGTVQTVSYVHGICHVRLDEPRLLDSSSAPGLKDDFPPHGRVELTKDF